MIYWRNIPRDAHIIEHAHTFEVQLTGAPVTAEGTEGEKLTAYWMEPEERDAVRVLRSRARQIARAS